MIDGSKRRKSLAGVEVQSPYVIERRSKMECLIKRKKTTFEARYFVYVSLPSHKSCTMADTATNPSFASFGIQVLNFSLLFLVVSLAIWISEFKYILFMFLYSKYFENLMKIPSNRVCQNKNFFYPIANRILLSIPKTKKASYGNRSFSAITPRVWNDLPS